MDVVLAVTGIDYYHSNKDIRDIRVLTIIGMKKEDILFLSEWMENMQG